MNRREFLVSSMAVTTTVMAGTSTAFAAPAKRPLGVQLYTVRNQAEKDLPSVLAAIKKIGYDEVETYWSVYTHPAAELKKLISDNGLQVPSGHFDYDGLEGKMDYAATLGLEFMICPMLPEKDWNSLDAYRKFSDVFNRWGEMVKQRGMRFGFHNHNYEFRHLRDADGKDVRPWDVLMARTDPSLVCVEMDCYWVTEAGLDPIAMFQTLGDRIRMIHLKDRLPGFPISQEKDDAAEHFTPVGTGTIDWKAVIAAAEKNNIRHMFVEQDKGGVPLQNLGVSYKTVRAIL